MGPTELACARCGRFTPVERLSVWEQDEHYRVFQGPARRTAEGAVYSRVRKHCAYLTCSPCHDRLRGGAGLNDFHNRKIAVFTAAVAAMGLLIVIFTPILLPRLLIAFWWW